MGIERATFWGAVVIFALITYYCWFISDPKKIIEGIGSFLFMLFLAWLGIKIK